VDQDYDDYLRSTFQGGINQSEIRGSSEGETKNEKLKRNIKARATTEFDIAMDSKKVPLLGRRQSEDETTERPDFKSRKSSSAEIEFDVDEEFSKSFQEMITPGLKQVLTTVQALKRTLNKQVQRCVNDVQTDMKDM
jgi:hypothetical protein